MGPVSSPSAVLISARPKPRLRFIPLLVGCTRNVRQYLHDKRLHNQRKRESEPSGDDAAAIHPANPARRLSDDGTAADIQDTAGNDESPDDVATVQTERLPDAVHAAAEGRSHGISNEEAERDIGLLQRPAPGNARPADGAADAGDAGQPGSEYDAAVRVSIQPDGAAAEHEAVLHAAADGANAAGDSAAASQGGAREEGAANPPAERGALPHQPADLRRDDRQRDLPPCAVCGGGVRDEGVEGGSEGAW